MTVEQVRHRRRRALWVVHAGAALRHRDLAPDRFAGLHAVALTWPDAVTCLASAARAHGLPVSGDPPVDAVVPHARPARHRLQPRRYRLPESDVVKIDGRPVTSLLRTVVDCLGLLTPHEAEAMLIWVLTRRVVTHAELVRAVEERPFLTGNRRRRLLLARSSGGALGAAERRLHDILATASITGWRANVAVSDGAGLIGCVDVLFEADRLVVEVDGLAYHGADRFQSDRTRQNRLVNAGYRVLRFIWDDLVTRPATVRAQIQAARSSAIG